MVGKLIPIKRKRQLNRVKDRYRYKEILKIITNEIETTDRERLKDVHKDSHIK